MTNVWKMTQGKRITQSSVSVCSESMRWAKAGQKNWSTLRVPLFSLHSMATIRAKWISHRLPLYWKVSGYIPLDVLNSDCVCVCRSYCGMPFFPLVDFAVHSHDSLTSIRAENDNKSDVKGKYLSCLFFLIHFCWPFSEKDLANIFNRMRNIVQESASG